MFHREVGVWLVGGCASLRRTVTVAGEFCEEMPHVMRDHLVPLSSLLSAAMRDSAPSVRVTALGATAQLLRCTDEDDSLHIVEQLIPLALSVANTTDCDAQTIGQGERVTEHGAGC